MHEQLTCCVQMYVGAHTHVHTHAAAGVSHHIPCLSVQSRIDQPPWPPAQVLTVTGDAELLRSLTEANKQLEQVQSGLAEYLETKRLAFPRFFFLSNDEVQASNKHHMR